MRYLDAGESHGKGLTAIIEGLPSGLKIDLDKINDELSRRQKGYGRGGRMKIETDKAEILSGVRNGYTLGSPVTLFIKNKDFESWAGSMGDGECVITKRTVTEVRPGHADLSGCVKYGFDDARNVLERASARETAIRVAVGGVLKGYLKELGVEISSYVKEICGVKDEGRYAFDELSKAKCSDTGMLDETASKKAKERIDALKEDGDTAGGVVEVRVRGLKSGFGSVMTYGEKLDARLAQGLMSIQAVKGVEIGLGFGVANISGKGVHDEIYYEEGKGYYRETNRAGGLEGGMSNGEELVLRIAMKPIPTLMRGLSTVDTETLAAAKAASERSDVCAIVAMEIIAEAVVAQVLAFAVSELLGGDTMEQVKNRYQEL